MTNQPEPVNTLISAAEHGTLSRKLKTYLKSCRMPDGDPKKQDERLPNFAGFCASLGCGTRALDALRKAMPDVFDYLAAVLEDEALNSSRSPAIVNAYIKEKFSGKDGTEQGGLQIFFEHNVLEDGA